MERINELARLSKTRALSDAEKQEQASLRAQYLSEFRAGMKGMLESITVVDEQGNKSKLKPKEPAQ